MSQPYFDIVGLTNLNNDPLFREIDGQFDDDRGERIAVATIDTGLDAGHSLFGDRVIEFVDFVDGTPEAFDPNGHGTHTAGIIGADNLGVAPEVNLIGLRALGDNQRGDEILQALQWVLDNRSTFNIVAVNLSLGVPAAFFDDPANLNNDFAIAVSGAIADLEAAGITVISAAGNDYFSNAPTQNVSTPAISSTLAVGAVWQDSANADRIWRGGSIDNTTGADRVASFSQRLDFENFLFAPGAIIESTFPGERIAGLAGTSQASPVVAGAVALLQDAALTFGDRLLSPTEVREILISSADLVTDGDDEDTNVAPTDATFRRLNIYEAVREVERRFSQSAAAANAAVATAATAPEPRNVSSLETIVGTNLAIAPQIAPAAASTGNIVSAAGTGVADPRDPNGTVGGAVEIDFTSELQQFFSDNIGSDSVVGATDVAIGATDVDLFHFEIETPSVFVALTDGPPGATTDTILTLFDAEGTIIAANDQNSQGTNFSELAIPQLDPGTYFVGVSGFNNSDYDPFSIDSVARAGLETSQGDYTLGVGIAPVAPPLPDGADPRDPNGTINGAVEIDFASGPQQTVSENIGNDGNSVIGASDVDLFRIEIETLSALTALTDGPPGAATDTILALFDADGTIIDFNDQNSQGTNFSELTIPQLAPGTYFVGISGFNNTGYDPLSIDSVARAGLVDSQGDYTLSVEIADVNPSPPGEIDSRDPNGTINGAVEIDFADNSQQTVSENIGSDGNSVIGVSDVDLFRFDVDVPSTFAAITNGPLGTDTILALFDAGGNIIDFNDQDSVGTNFSELGIPQLAPGTYFIGVSGFNNFGYDPNNIDLPIRGGLPESQGDYTLDLALVAAGDQDGIFLTATSLGEALGTGSDSVNNLLSPTVATIGTIGEDFGGISLDGDVDLIRFEVGGGGGLVTIETQPAPNDPAPLDSILRLFDAQGQEIAFDDDSGPDLYSSIVASLEPGVYFAGISGFSNSNYNPFVSGSGVGGSTGAYQAVFQFEPFFGGGGDLTGTLGTALPLGDLGASNVGFSLSAPIGVDSLIGSAGTPINVAVGPADVDLFSFEVPSDGLLLLETNDFVPPDVPAAAVDPGGDGRIDPRNDFGGIPDTSLRLFDAQGQEIAFDDDGGDGLFSRITADLPAAGTYFFGVSSFPNFLYDPTVADVAADSENRFNGSTGIANLDVIFQPNSGSAIDLDGIRLGANPIVLNLGSAASFTGALGTDSFFQVDNADVDLYEFTASADGTLLIDTDTPPGVAPIADTLLRFFDIFGNDITPAVDNNGDGIFDRDDGLAENFAGNFVEFDTNTTGFDFSEVVDPSGVPVGNDRDSFLRVDVEAGTTYFIGVSGFGNEAYDLDTFDNRSATGFGGEYTLNIAYGGASAGSDTDGAIDTAAPTIALSPSQPFQVNNANIGQDDGAAIGFTDVDFYRVTPTETGILNINIDAFELPDGSSLAGAVDSTIFVFDANGNEIAFNDDTDNLTGLGFLDSALQLPVQAGQELFVGVSGYGNFGFDPNIVGSGPGGSTGSYNLTLDLTATDPGAVAGGDDRIIFGEFLAALSASDNPQALELDLDRGLFELYDDEGNLDAPPGVIFTELGPNTSAFVLGELGLDSSVEEEAPDPTQPSLPELPDRSHPGGPIFASLSGIESNAISIQVAEDVDLFPLRVLADGFYDLNSENTVANNPQLLEFGATTTLLLFDAQAQQVADFAIESDRVLAELAAGDYVLVVLPEGTEGSFDLLTQEFNPPDDSLELVAQNSGSYQLFLEAFALENDNNPEIDGGAFSLQLNNTPDRARLGLYDGLDLDEFGGASVTVVDAQGNPVPGSLVVDTLANGSSRVTFVPSAPLAAGGTYALNYRSADFVAANQLLNGGTDIAHNVEVPEVGATVSVPSFARGPGQSIDLPIAISGGLGINAIDLSLAYDPSLLTIGDVRLTDTLVADGWTIAFDIDASNGEVTVELTGGENPLPVADGDLLTLVELAATLPEGAPLQGVQILEITGGARSGQLGSGTSQPIAISGSAAIHTATFFGDVNGDRSVDFGDALALANMALANVNGFDFGPLDLIDPHIIGDIDGNNAIDQDDALAAVAEFLGDSPLIPDISASAAAASEADSAFVISTPVPQDGETAVVSTLGLVDTLEASEGIGNFQVVIQYPTDLLDITAADVTLSQELIDLGYVIEGGVQIDEAAGEIRFGTLPTQGNFIAANTTPDLAVLNFTLQPNAQLDPNAITFGAGTNIFSPAAVSLTAPAPEPFPDPTAPPNPDDPTTPDPDDPTAPPNPDDPTAPNPDDPTAPNPDDPTAPNPDDPTAPNPDDPTNPGPGGGGGDGFFSLDLDGVDDVVPAVDVLNIFRVLAGAPQAVVLPGGATVNQQAVVDAVNAFPDLYLDVDSSGDVAPAVDVLNIFRVLAGAPQAVALLEGATVNQQAVVDAVGALVP